MSAVPTKVLLVDSDSQIRAFLRRKLSRQGYEVIEASSDCAALNALVKQPTLIILDPDLAGVGGDTILRRLRKWNDRVPIIVLSNKDDEAERIEAFNEGACSYIAKPFGMDELLARIRVALRRQLQMQGVRPLFRVGGVSIDLVRQAVTLNGRDAQLSSKQYELLRTFVVHAGKVLSHNFLLEELWGVATDRQHVRVAVQLLRRKIESDPLCPRIIQTEQGVGYRLREPVSAVMQNGR